MLMTVLAGQPVMETSNFVLVPLKVMVAVPEQEASASVIGGFSFAALSSALKVFAGVGDGDAVGGAVGGGVRGAARPPPGGARVPPAPEPAKKRLFPNPP